MRVFVIWCLSLLFTAVPGFADAIIHLKGGDAIRADRVTESGSMVTYEVGDNSFTIPRSRIQSIESETRPAAAAPGISEMPQPAPEFHLGGEVPVLGNIVRGGEVDRSALAAIEARGNTREIAVAYYIAGRAEFQAGKFAEARRDFEAGLHNDADNPALLNYYAAVLVRTGNAVDAIAYCEKAAQLAPDSADAFAVFGYAQFASNHVRDAIESWKKSLALRPDASIQQILARAERESSAEKTYSQHETGHFVLHYEGTQNSEAFREQLVETLESHYRDLSREFGAEPRSTIQVILYTNRAFFDVTRAPLWIGALNDGKLRIPVDGLTSVTPDLSRVLHHELTHSFISQVTLGRCPHWLNEGVAQLMEPRTVGARLPRLAELYKLQHEIPINQLEMGFTSFNTQEAALAYDESLAVADYLRDRYGMNTIVRILEQVGAGESTEAALRGTIHSDYGQLEDDLRNYLIRQAEN